MPLQHTAAPLSEPVRLPLDPRVVRLAASNEPHPYREGAHQALLETLTQANQLTRERVANRVIQNVVSERFGLHQDSLQARIETLLSGRCGPDGAGWLLRRRRALRELQEGNYRNYSAHMARASNDTDGLLGAFPDPTQMDMLERPRPTRFAALVVPDMVTADPLHMLVRNCVVCEAPVNASYADIRRRNGVFSVPMYAALELLWRSGNLPPPPNGDVRAAFVERFNPTVLRAGHLATIPPAGHSSMQNWEQHVAECIGPWPVYYPASAANPAARWPGDPVPEGVAASSPPSYIAAQYTFTPSGAAFGIPGAAVSSLIERERLLGEVGNLAAGYSWLNYYRADRRQREEWNDLLGVAVPVGTQVVVIDRLGLLEYVWQASNSLSLFQQGCGSMFFPLRASDHSALIAQQFSGPSCAAQWARDYLWTANFFQGTRLTMHDGRHINVYFTTTSSRYLRDELLSGGREVVEGLV